MANAKTLLNVGLIVLIFCSCNKEDKFTVAHEKKIASFTSSMGGESYTRASDTLWDIDDQIGVFMKTAESVLSSTTIVSDAANKRYTTEDKAIFRAFDESHTIYYPDDNSAVDFIAYYPYQSGITDFVYKVNVSNQTSQEAIDLLYSDNAKNQTHSSFYSNLVFSHQLTKIKFMVEAGTGISLDELDVSISGVYATADFKLADGTLTATDQPNNTIALKITGETSGKKIAEAILVPDNGETERVVTFKLKSGKTFRHKIEVGTKLEKNSRYTFTARLGGSGTIEPQTGYVETPLMTNLPATQQYVVHMMPDREGRNFAMLYDTEQRLAYWVAYPLVPSYHVGDTERTNAWRYDPTIDNEFQPNLSKSFPAANTDRGHQIPSGDRTCSKDVNRMTFYYSNMTAQQSTLNQQMWAYLEEGIRVWATRCDTMYVVTGAMIQTATDPVIDHVKDNSGRDVARPKYYFKALAQRTGDSYTTIAFRMDNKAPADNDYNKHRLTVKALEIETGFTFFPSLPDNIKDKITSSDWN